MALNPSLAWHWARFDQLGVHALHDTLALRCRVFILEQGPYQDPDGADKQSFHLLGYGSLQGAEVHPGSAGASVARRGAPLLASLRVVDPGVKYAEPAIGRVVTAPEARGTGAGRALMEEGIARCSAVWPGQGIRISAQAHLRGFYGSLGFEAASDVYLEDDIPHLEMLRR